MNHRAYQWSVIPLLFSSYMYTNQPHYAVILLGMVSKDRTRSDNNKSDAPKVEVLEKFHEDI